MRLQNFPHHLAACRNTKHRLLCITEQLSLHLHQLPPLFLSVKYKNKKQTHPLTGPAAPWSSRLRKSHFPPQQCPADPKAQKFWSWFIPEELHSLPKLSWGICWVNCREASFCSNPSGPRRITWMNFLFPLWKDGSVPILVIILKHIQSLNQGIALRVAFNSCYFTAILESGSGQASPTFFGITGSY